MRRYLVTLILVLLLTTVAYSQGDLALYLFVNGSVPTGDFAKTSTFNTGPTRRSGFYWGDKIGLANSGFGIGAELFSPTGIQGLQWIFSSKLLLNSVNDDDAKAIFVERTHAEKSINFHQGYWMNIPVLTGFRYDVHFTHQYTLYGILQAGINVSRAPSRRIAVGGLRSADNTTYKFARDFGYEAGIGFMLNLTYNLSFRYLNLGTPRYDGDQKLSEVVFPSIYAREQAILGEERSISMFLVTLGVQLFR